MKIHFFSVLVGLETTGSGSSRSVSKLRFQAQAEVPGGEYRPLVPPATTEKVVDGSVLDWPHAPDLTQIVEYTPGIDYYDRWQFVPDPAHQFEVPQRQVDPTAPAAFDDCVLAIPAATIKLLDTDLLTEGPSGDRRWRRMVAVDAVQTRSMQLWFKPKPEELYSLPKRGLTTDFEQPEPSFGDFTHLGKSEGWDGATPEPGLAAYFCGCLPPTELAPSYDAAHASYPADQKAAFKAAARTWLETKGYAFFDKVPAGKLEEQLVWGSYDEQYYVAAVQPQDLYYVSAGRSDATACPAGRDRRAPPPHRRRLDPHGLEHRLCGSRHAIRHDGRPCDQRRHHHHAPRRVLAWDHRDRRVWRGG